MHNVRKRFKHLFDPEPFKKGSVTEELQMLMHKQPPNLPSLNSKRSSLTAGLHLDNVTLVKLRKQQLSAITNEGVRRKDLHSFTEKKPQQSVDLERGGR